MADPRIQVPTSQDVANLLLDYLELEGVEVLFGIPGGALISLLCALKDREKKLPFIVCRHESGAAFAADGYARSSGKLGVVMTTSGPAATNALTGTMNAQAAGSRLLLITGEMAQKYVGRGYLQEGLDGQLDVVGVYRNAIGYSALVTTVTDAQALIEQALRNALTPPGGAAHLTLPDDVSGSPVPPGTVRPRTPRNYRADPQFAIAANDVGTLLDHLTAATKPLIFLGNGCRRALLDPAEQGGRTRVERFAASCASLAIPVMTTPDGKGMFPESHAMSLGMYGKASMLWPSAYMGGPPSKDPKFDALLVIGSSLHQLATENWSPTLRPEGPFVQVDLDSTVIGRDFPVDLGIVADAGRVIDELCQVMERHRPDVAEQKRVQQRAALVAGIRRTTPYRGAAKRDSTVSPCKPQALMKCFKEMLPPESQVFIDGGNCIGWAVHHILLDPPSYRVVTTDAAKGQMHNSLDMGPMGCGTASIIGAKVACPDKTCVTLTGDGGFMMHGSEISTASQYGLGAIWIVLNDDDLGMVSQGQYVFSPQLESRKTPDPSWKGYYRLGGPDLVRYAEGLGADAEAVHDPAEFRAAFARALERSRMGGPRPAGGPPFHQGGKPQVVVVHVDTNEIPPYYPPQLMPPGTD